ncbi:MAG: hypothetical protein WAU07_03730 [Microgenomates group bacterium]
MRNLFKKFTENIESNIILTAAELKGWEVRVLLNGAKPLSEIRKNNLIYRVLQGRFSVNSSISTSISSDKFLTQSILEKAQLYGTNAKLYTISELGDEECATLLQMFSKVVVKPVDENNGIGITVGLTDLESIKRAIKKVSDLGSKQVLIEQHIDTISEYRVILWKGQIVDVLHRIPAYVAGNGASTIQELIEQKNAYRYENFGTVFEPIIIDEDLNLLLAKSGKSLSTILPADSHLTVKNTCNLSQGGEVKRIDPALVHPEYRDIFKKIYQETWLNYCGADLITPDIQSAPIPGKTAVNELNGGPGITLAFYDDVATDRMYYGMFELLARMERDPVQGFVS